MIKTIREAREAIKRHRPAYDSLRKEWLRLRNQYEAKELQVLELEREMKDLSREIMLTGENMTGLGDVIQEAETVLRSLEEDPDREKRECETERHLEKLRTGRFTNYTRGVDQAFDAAVERYEAEQTQLQAWGFERTLGRDITPPECAKFYSKERLAQIAGEQAA